MLFTFDPNFINDNKEFMNEILLDSLKDTVYALVVYGAIILMGLFI